MFEDNAVKIPDTNFINQLEHVVSQEQFQQTIKDIVKALTNSKEDFCKVNSYSLQNAKT